MACLLAMAAYAQAGPARQIDIPASDLVTALDKLAKQSGAQFIYRADQLRGVRTRGVRGNLPSDAALDRLLQGTGYTTHRDASGAVVIVKAVTRTQAAPRQAAPPADDADMEPEPPEATELEAVQVTGSRIPRAQIEGPAPITIITAEEIEANGFTSVPDVLRSVTQNGGATQSQQSFSGSSFTPGAEQVDLRGLGPSKTLVLVNGRRIANFPMPFVGRSNVADISNIPLGMIDRVEVLTGSASAVYGSDAIAGVINFILKRQIDGTTIQYRYGDTERGGAESHELSVFSGYSRGNFNAVFGIEFLHKEPLWAYERDIQDSTEDGPTERSRVARRVFLRSDENDDYLDPGKATCDALSALNDGTTYYAERPNYGFYCGSNESIGYGTILSGREGADAYGSLSYMFGDSSEWFADILLGYHEVELFRDVAQWSYQAPDGNEAGYFFNQATGQIEYWQRQFTPEEMGGLEAGLIKNRQKTFSIATGFNGTFARNWDYEAAFSYSRYSATISWPQIIAAPANDLYLGPQLGVDPASQLPIFDADPDRLYTPLTRTEYEAIAKDTVYNPWTRTSTLSFTTTNSSLFDLPAGPVGFAGVVEYGSQAYDLNVDPLAQQYYYYSWRTPTGEGDRTRWATAGELRAPLLESLNLSIAGRYDRYRFAGRNTGKFTYSAGLEWRALDSLLLRGSYGTAFRAPDLHYVFAGEGNVESSGIDYYRCRTESPGTGIEDCAYNDEGVIVTRTGNRDLESETSESWTAGVVWSPSANFDLSVDYFDIDLRDEVQYQRTDELLQAEADCRIGTTDDGDPVDVDSQTCVNAIARITRLGNGNLYGVFVNPINVARERTSGVNVSTNYRLQTGIGDFRFSGSYTWVREHVVQLFPGDPVEDQLRYDSGYYIPRTKASASLTYERGPFSTTLHGERLGHLPNYAEDDWIDATYLYNLSGIYEFSNGFELALSINNLLDELPPRDPTWSGYPYYDISWFDSVGRRYYVQFTYKFGSSTL